MVGPWFTTPWRLVSQSYGAVAWRFRPPCPSHVPFPIVSSRQRPVPSVPWTPYPFGPLCGPSHRPFPAPSPCLIIPCLYPTGSPAALWPWPTGASSIQGPFRAPSTGRSLSAPVPFPCAAAPAYSPGLSCGPIPSLFPGLYPTGPPATLWRGPTGSSSIWGPFCAPSTGRSPPSPAPLSCAVSLAVLVTWGRRVALANRPFLSRLLVVLRGVVRVCFPFFFFLLFSAWFPPPCMHAQQHCIAICLGSVRCSRPVPPPPCGVAPVGPRPCRASQPFSPRCCTCICSLSSLPSPPLCILPALLVLFPCSMCSPLVVSAPWLYPARPHVPQGLTPVFRPVGRPRRPPQTPLRGDPPVVLSRRPPLHQFPDGRAGRPVRLYAGHRHGASLRETMCSLAPSLAPCSPHLPRPATSMCPSCVSARPAVVFFSSFFSVLVLLAAPARPACALCSSSCYPGPAALRSLSRLSPLPFSFSPSTLPAPLPSLSVQRCHSRVPLVCPTPAPPPRPSSFPWVLPWSPPLTPSWLPGALCGGGEGGCICGLDCGPVPPPRLHSREWRYGMQVIVLQLGQ